MTPKVQLRGVYKIFGPRDKEMMTHVRAGVGKDAMLADYGHVLGLQDINVDMQAGEITVVMGLSGSGKSTLIRHLNRLIEPTAGEIIVQGKDVMQLSEDGLRHARQEKMSMVFQKFALLPHKTVLKNAGMPLSVRGEDEVTCDREAAKWLDRVGLSGFENHYPAQLSGGMQQRVGLARALAANPDVLLMDDIQFLAGREQTQEEFFHTFNALYHSDKQIVVTSDVYPQQIPEMQERLISRFQSGMVADVQAPELDTRIAILQKKAESESIELHGEVALFLAQAVRSNVRELEGTLLRIAVKAELLGLPIDLELAKETLRAVAPSQDTAMTVEEIQRIVCGYFGIRLADLKSRRRHRAVSFPRMIAMYICRQRLGTSYPELGERFGGKDQNQPVLGPFKLAQSTE